MKTVRDRSKPISRSRSSDHVGRRPISSDRRPGQNYERSGAIPSVHFQETSAPSRASAPTRSRQRSA